MKLKQLASFLQEIEDFANPKFELEQYKTSAELAARILFTIQDDICGKLVGDLGCGTGILGIGAAALGADFVWAFDIDPDAIDQTLEHAERLEVEDAMEVVRADVTAVGSLLRSGARKLDTCILNPPFGTRKAGVDMAFLRTALEITHEAGVVYSLHKSSTRAHILKTATESWGCAEAEVVAELKFDLPSTYAFHRESSVDVAVDLIRLSKRHTRLRGGGDAEWIEEAPVDGGGKKKKSNKAGPAVILEEGGGHASAAAPRGGGELLGGMRKIGRGKEGKKR